MNRKYDPLQEARGILLGAIIGALLWAAAFQAFAANLTVGANLVSLHTQSRYTEQVGSYEVFTPGLYAKYGDTFFAAGGVYRNSYGFTTAHASVGGSMKVDRWDFSLQVGASYGYREWQGWVNPDGSTFATFGPPEVRALVVPSVGFAIDSEWTVRAIALPKSEKSGAACLSFSIERKF